MLRLSLVLFLSTAALQSQTVQIPDTPAGQALTAWLEAFNSGDRAKIQAYITKFDPAKSVDDIAGFRAQTGPFQLLGIQKSEPQSIAFLVKEANGTTTALGKLRLKDGTPIQVASLNVRALPPGTNPSDLVLTIDAATRSRVIDGVAAKLHEYYVFPDLATKMEQAVRERQKRGEYDKVEDGDAFATLLTEHLREVSKDRHLGVNYFAVPPPSPPKGGPTPEMEAQMRTRMERDNCAFEKAERLPSNIGYLKFNAFMPPHVCGPTVSAAMGFLANVDALIIDLRTNGGGDPAMVAFISSYLFAKPTHLNDIYNRKEDSTQQFWTLSYVPGKRLADKPVFVLTSKRTFSGAEEFSYNLKNQKRATIIGETTGGGAHPVSGHRVDERFMIGVPFARAINPISKTNWEGTGVEPDVKAPADEALSVAIKMAGEQIKKK